MSNLHRGGTFVYCASFRSCNMYSVCVAELLPYRLAYMTELGRERQQTVDPSFPHIGGNSHRLARVNERSQDLQRKLDLDRHARRGVDEAEEDSDDAAENCGRR